MNILDSMKDIVKHTGGLGFLDMVKIVGEKYDRNKVAERHRDHALFIAFAIS